MAEVIKRSVMIAGHATSVTLEDLFWQQLKKLAHHQKKSMNALITEIDNKNDGNLSSAIRCYVLTSILQSIQE